MSILKAMRKEQNLSVSELSHMTGIGTQTLYQYERGHPIPFEKAALLAYALGCMPCDLMEVGTDCPFRQYRRDAGKGRILELLDRTNEKNLALVIDILESLLNGQG